MSCVVIKLHDEQNEGLSRAAICDMIVKASGGELTRKQAQNTWDKTIHPYGKRNGILTGYVKSQDGSSKRTASGDIQLQHDWHLVVDALLAEVEKKAQEVLQDSDLVHAMMPSLVCNLDEECVHALGKNTRIVGAKGKKKHNNVR